MAFSSRNSFTALFTIPAMCALLRTPFKLRDQQTQLSIDLRSKAYQNVLQMKALVDEIQKDSKCSPISQLDNVEANRSIHSLELVFLCFKDSLNGANRIDGLERCARAQRRKTVRSARAFFENRKRKSTMSSPDVPFEFFKPAAAYSICKRRALRRIAQQATE